MEKVVDKKLISQLLKLDFDQQEKVLAYIKDLLITNEMNKRAEQSENAIAEGHLKSFNKFNTDFEEWKIQKRISMK